MKTGEQIKQYIEQRVEEIERIEQKARSTFYDTKKSADEREEANREMDFASARLIAFQSVLEKIAEE